MIKSKKEFACNAIKEIQKLEANYNMLLKFGIDISEYNEPIIDLLLDSVALLLTNSQSAHDDCIQQILWWLYEKVDKIIYQDGKPKWNVSNVETFVEWLVFWYKDWESKKS